MALRDAGWSYGRIAKALGATAQAVYYAANDSVAARERGTARPRPAAA